MNTLRTTAIRSIGTLRNPALRTPASQTLSHRFSLGSASLLSSSSPSSSTAAAALRTYATMKAFVYKGDGQVGLEERPKPTLAAQSDAIVRLTKTTICGTDLHIRKGDVATCRPGTILGHEGVGVVEETGAAVHGFRRGDRVLVSCISACAACEYCRRGMPSHCTSGGWILGNTIDGTQAEFVRVPHADASLLAVPPGVAARPDGESALVMLSDIFPTGYECGVLNGRVSPGGTVAIVGAGPVGLAALLTAQLYSPSLVVVLDPDANRRRVALALGAHHAVDPTENPDAAEAGAGDAALAFVRSVTDGKGCDTVIEAVGVPATFETAQRLLAPGGVLANVGVHGTKADLFLQDLWDKNVSITTRLVDATSTSMLMKLVESGKLDPLKLITHRFKFSDMEKAYETFATASKHEALKVLVEM